MNFCEKYSKYSIFLIPLILKKSNSLNLFAFLSSNRYNFAKDKLRIYKPFN